VPSGTWVAHLLFGELLSRCRLVNRPEEVRIPNKFVASLCDRFWDSLLFLEQFCDRWWARGSEAR
jgi:hypothetical protein